MTSHDVYDQARQAFDNSKADYESAVGCARRRSSCWLFYTIRAPFDGVVGDVPVHVGDLVAPMNSPPSVLTTVDEGKDLEAYIYIPTERSSQVRHGAGRGSDDTSGKLLEKTKLDFLSPEVDPTMQEILVKAPVHVAPEVLRTAQIVKARVIWSTKPMAVVPVLGGHSPGRADLCFCGAGSRTGTRLRSRLQSRWAIRWATLTPSHRD